MGSIPRHLKLVTWHNLLVTDPDLCLQLPGRIPFPSSLLKHWLDGQGLAHTGWQIYFLHGDAVLDALGSPWFDDAHPDDSVRNAVTYLNLIAACNMGPHFLPPLALIRSIPQWGIPEQRLDLIHPNFFRALWGACTVAEYQVPNSQHAVEKFIKKVLLPVVRWYFSTGKHLDARFNDYLKCAAWITLNGGYGEWRAKREREAEEQSPAPAEWPVLVESFETDDLCFVPLASRRALKVEGHRMQHCIADHYTRCRSGEIQAFSIRSRKSGERVATMTIKETQPGVWELDDLKGYRNSKVPLHEHQGAQAVVKAAEEASRRISDDLVVVT